MPKPRCLVACSCGPWPHAGVTGFARPGDGQVEGIARRGWLMVEFGRWRLRCDPEATRRAYAGVPAGAPETCGCTPCRNFAAARQWAYPAEVLALFESLGISPDREAEVYHLARVSPGWHKYGGFLHLVGAMEAGEDALRPDGAVDLEAVGERFSLGFTAQAALVPPSFGGLPLVQLEFVADVPWVLAEPEPD